MIIRRPSGAVIVTERGGLMVWVFVIDLFVFGSLAAPLFYPALWSRDTAQMTGYAALLAIALIVSCVRAYRLGVRFDDDGVTVRNFSRTYRLGWEQVSRFADGGNSKGGWALTVICRDGRAITASGTLTVAKAEVLSAIRLVAERHQVGMEVTGQSRNSSWML